MTNSEFREKFLDSRNHSSSDGAVFLRQGFGRQPSLKKFDSSVKVVFDGVVQNVFSVSDVSAVMIRHGKYFTTYSNLGTVTVSKGEQVKTGQLLGRLADIGQLEFILSDDKDRNLNPQLWLRR